MRKKDVIFMAILWLTMIGMLVISVLFMKRESTKITEAITEYRQAVGEDMIF